MPTLRKARVFRIGRSQAVRIPAEYRFRSEEVYIEREPATGAIRLSERPLQEKPTRPSLQEVFKELDEAGAAEFELHRDLTPPIERDWLKDQSEPNASNSLMEFLQSLDWSGLDTDRDA